VLYSTSYPQLGMMAALCGVFLAMKAGRPIRAAGWAFFAGSLDPLGLLFGVSAGVWSAWSLVRRDSAGFRAGILWGLGSVAALGLMSTVLILNHNGPLAFIGAQRYSPWNSFWVWPWIQPVFAIVQFAAGGYLPPNTLSAVAVLPLFAWGTWSALRDNTGERWGASAVSLSAVIFLVGVSFYSIGQMLANSTAYWSVDVVALMAVVKRSTHRSTLGIIGWCGAWATVGAVWFTHGHFWA
jgi:hypothetical protein